MVSQGQLYDFGATFFDDTTGLWFGVHHPHERPDLWRAYLEGGERQYKKYKLAKVFGRESLEDGAAVSMFFVGMDAGGEMVAGFRCHGPLERPEQCAALAEMAHTSEAERLAETVTSFLPYGLIETKGAWSSVHGGHLSFKAIFRCGMHALNWFGSEYCVGTMSDRFAADVVGSGGIIFGNEPAPFPNHDYNTLLAVWRRSRIIDSAAAEEMQQLRRERRGLAATTAAPEIDGPPVTSWRPIILDTRKRSDRAIIEQLKRRPTTVLDHVAVQRSELAKLVPPVDDELLREQPRSAYYPWRKTLVRMVGPRGYRTLRVDRNRLKVTPAEQTRLGRLRVGIIGLSVGHAIAHALAMEGLCGELRLADFDTLETTNLNRLPGTVFDISQNKAVLAAQRIAEIDPYLGVSVFPAGFTTENADRFMAGLDLVIEECDSLDIKILVREIARQRRVPVIMATSDRGLFDVERFDLEPDRQLFHGLLGDISLDDLAGLSIKDKIPFLLKVLDASEISTRGAASMVEIGKTVSTWPQLSSDVILGAATAAAVVRRIGTGESLPSGRLRIDIDEYIASATNPMPAAEPIGDAGVAQPSPQPADAVTKLAFAAGLAPSGGNMQPWRFEGSDDRLDIFLVPERTAMMDVSFRGSYVAIGAALFNARCRAAADGLLGQAELFPLGDRGPVASLGLHEGSDDRLAELACHIEARCSNRRAGDASPIASADGDTLAGAAAAEGGRLHLVTDRARIEACAELLGSSDQLRFLTPDLYREMMHELRWPGHDSLEFGLDVRTLELDPADLATFAILRRPEVIEQLASWELGHALGDATRNGVASASALAVVTVPDSTPAAYVSGGQAVERVWLAATGLGLAIQPVSPAFIFALDDGDRAGLVGEARSAELADLDGRFRATVGLGDDERLCIAARLFRAPAPSFRSIRFPLGDLFSKHLFQPR
jgi:molybdopterin/thiamine biosynthesis adenylyltransferase